MSKRILVVDDDERVRLVFQKALARLGSGYQVEVAQNGREALEKAMEEPFDLIMTDLRMPELGGVELTKAIKRYCPDTIVVWMTSYGCHSLAAEARLLAVYRCLEKPLEVSEIRQVAREALESAGAHSRG